VATEKGETVSISVDHHHPLLQVERWLAWAIPETGSARVRTCPISPGAPFLLGANDTEEAYGDEQQHELTLPTFYLVRVA